MPYTRPYTGGFKDYPDTTTPINATALNTMDVGIKTANDQFQTVTTAQRTALTPTVGQAVWDSDLKQLMVYMNASGGNAWQPVGNRIVCASTTRPSTPFEGQEIYETDTNLSYVYDGSTWKQWLNTAWIPSSGSYANRFASYRYNTANVTLTGTTSYSTLTTIGTAADLTLNASTGDVIEFIPNFIVDSSAVDMGFDVVTVVGGVVTNSFFKNGAAPAAASNFLQSGYYCIGGNYTQVTGSIFYTLQAGDISSGTVTVRLRYAMSSATNRTIYCSSTAMFALFARNLGPVTT